MLKNIRLHIEKVEKKQATVDENSIEKNTTEWKLKWTFLK
jgi:hypothetical protein